MQKQHRRQSQKRRITKIGTSSSTSLLPQEKNANSKSNINSNTNMDETTGKCKYGIKNYWDKMYEGTGDRPSQSYSWYCGWTELSPFWTELVPDRLSHILIAGIGNDLTPSALYDEGWRNITAFDYSESGVKKARNLFGEKRSEGVTIMTADARDLPICDGSVDAVLDKGTLDAIFIAGEEIFQEAVKEMTRVTAKSGVMVCVSNVIPSEVLLKSFNATSWENIHDGGLAFAPDGEATIDLGADLLSWRRL